MLCVFLAVVVRSWVLGFEMGVLAILEMGCQ